MPDNDLSHYPLFVKPVNGCGSEGIDNSSLCFSRAELNSKISALDCALAPGRKPRSASAPKTSFCQDDHQGIPSDILVTEYIGGTDYVVVVCKVGPILMTLCPERWRLPAVPTATKGRCQEHFLTQEIKYHPDSHVSMMDREECPQLFDALQTTALEAWQAADNGADWGHVDMRVRPSGEVVALEVNPMPAIFTPPEKHQWDDPAVAKWFPGGHRSLLNSAIAGRRLQRTKESNRIERLRNQKISTTYDGFSDSYDKGAASMTKTVDIIKHCVSNFAFAGKVLDLGCGTGAFGTFSP